MIRIKWMNIPNSILYIFILAYLLGYFRYASLYLIYDKKREEIIKELE